MSDLTPEAEDLVRAGRSADLPSDADRERILEALRGRLGGDVVGAKGANLGLRTGVPRPLFSRWIVIGLASLAGTIMLYGFRSMETPARILPQGTVAAARASEPANGAALANAGALPESSSTAPTLLAVTNEATVSPSSAAASISPHSVTTRAAGSLRARDGLSEEVAILSRAETELRAAHFENALSLLDDHERRFPHGALEQERTAARIQALCALGRTAEADEQLVALTRAAPNSPHEERARQACRDALSPAH